MAAHHFPTFIQTSKFTERWASLGLGDDDLRGLERVIANGPRRAPVVAQTGGLRKIRFALPGHGKSGGVRVGYAVFDKPYVVFLFTAYTHARQNNLSPVEKRQIAALIREVDQILHPKENDNEEKT
jgi:hypothetical protein